QIGTLAAITQNISKLEGEISQKQGQIKQLNDQRAALLAQADQAAKTAEKQTGKAVLEPYKQASDLRKHAADLGTQAETLAAQIVPLQKDLAIAQGQQVVLNNAVAEFQKQAQLLDEHWKAVQAQIIAQQELAKQITGGGAPSEPTTQPAETADATGKSINDK